MLKVLEEFISSLNLADAGLFQEKMRLFHAKLATANQEFNLTRLSTLEDFEIKHVYDSLALLKYGREFLLPGKKLCDVGCGAGFPSVVLAAARPDLQINAFDSTGKKADFVAKMAKELELSNLTAAQFRSNEAARKIEYHGKFDLVTARAVAAAPKIVKESIGLLKPHGSFLLYQTPRQSAEELPEVAKDKLRHWYKTEDFELPENAGSRCFLIGAAK